MIIYIESQWHWLFVVTQLYEGSLFCAVRQGMNLHSPCEHLPM